MKKIFKLFLIIFSVSLFALDFHENRITSFLTLLYKDILGREADSEGIYFWQKALYEQNQTALEVARYFFTSKELKEQNLSNREYIKRVYETLLQREPDREGFSYWLDMLENKKIPRLQLFYRFVFSKEFEKLTLSHEILPFDKKDLMIAFLERFYNLILMRDSDLFGLNYWYEMLKNKKKTPKSIAKDFFYSKEFLNRKLSDDEFVKIAYRTLLNREPEDEGYYFWLDKLKNGYSRDRLLDDFLDSKEFRDILNRFLKRDIPIFEDVYPPIFNTPENLRVDDNQTKVLKLKAFDRSSPIKYNLSGEDSRFFEIENGYLIEREPLFFRNPKDKNRDNVYEIEIEAFDSKGNSVKREIFIKVCPKFVNKIACKIGLYEIASKKFSGYVNGVLKFKDKIFAIDKYGKLFEFKEEKRGNILNEKVIKIDDLLMDIDIFKDYLLVLGGREGVFLFDLNSSSNQFRNIINIDGGEKFYLNKNSLFIIEADGNIEIYDIKNPLSPKFVNSLTFLDNVSSIFVKDNMAFVCANENGVYIFDISDLENIKRIGLIKNRATIKDIVVDGNFAYLAAFDEGVYIFDISDLKNPKEIKHIKLDSKSIKILKSRDYLFIADLYAGLKVVDVLEPKKAKMAGYIASKKAQDLWLDGNYLYIADGKGGIKEIDISNPITKDILSRVTFRNGAYKVLVDGDRAFVADFNKNIDLINISDKANPVLLKNLNFRMKDSLEFADEDYVDDMKIFNNYLFVARGFRGVEIFDKKSFSLISLVDVNGSAQSVSINDNVLYVGEGKKILGYDISNIYEPKKIFEYSVNFKISVIKKYSNGLIAFSDDGDIDIFSFAKNSLNLTSSIGVRGNIFDIEAKGGYLFLAKGKDGLEIFDLKSLKRVFKITSFGGYVVDIKIYKNYLFVCDLYNGVKIFDISNILHPKFIAKSDLYGILSIDFDGEFLYTADFNYGFSVLDVNFIQNKISLIRKEYN